MSQDCRNIFILLHIVKINNNLILRTSIEHFSKLQYQRYDTASILFLDQLLIRYYLYLNFLMASIKKYSEKQLCTPTKGQEYTTKNIKNTPTLREGDWICSNCSNLNFSFRTICNRCKNQTKQCNYYNYIIPMNNLNYYTFLTESKKANNIQKQNQWSTQNKTNKSSTNAKQLKVFQNALFLTPTKDQNIINFQQNKQQPYNSPIKIPSVETLLKKFNDVSILSKYSPNEINYTSVQVSDFNKMIKKQEKQDTLDLEIQRILNNIKL